MIAVEPYEPFIYIGPLQEEGGKIQWLPADSEVNSHWRRYADFEREKLDQLTQKRGCSLYSIGTEGGWFLMGYDSEDLIDYSPTNYHFDSDSGRILKRAEFLKAVCEKEGVEWLPKEDDGSYQPCSICGERIKKENEAVVGHHFSCSNPKRDYYTKAEVDERIAAAAHAEIVCKPKSIQDALHEINATISKYYSEWIKDQKANERRS